MLSPQYWPALRVLAHSLSHRGNITGLDWVVMTDKPAPPGWGDWLGRCGFGIDNRLFSEIGKLPEKRPELPKGGEWALNRLLMFLLPPGEYICLDADMLCMRDATDVLGAPSISAVIGPVVGGWLTPGVQIGLVRFDASQDLFDKCVDEMAAGHRYAKMNEQTILHWVLRRYPELLRREMAGEWNTKSMGTASLENAIFIHFAYPVKPWVNGNLATNKIWSDYAASILPYA